MSSSITTQVLDGAPLTQSSSARPASVIPASQASHPNSTSNHTIHNSEMESDIADLRTHLLSDPAPMHGDDLPSRPGSRLGFHSTTTLTGAVLLQDAIPCAPAVSATSSPPPMSSSSSQASSSSSSSPTASGQEPIRFSRCFVGKLGTTPPRVSSPPSTPNTTAATDSNGTPNHTSITTPKSSSSGKSENEVDTDMDITAARLIMTPSPSSSTTSRLSSLLTPLPLLESPPSSIPSTPPSGKITVGRLCVQKRSTVGSLSLSLSVAPAPVRSTLTADIADSRDPDLEVHPALATHGVRSRVCTGTGVGIGTGTAGSGGAGVHAKANGAGAGCGGSSIFASRRSTWSDSKSTSDLDSDSDLDADADSDEVEDYRHSFGGVDNLFIQRQQGRGGVSGSVFLSLAPVVSSASPTPSAPATPAVSPTVPLGVSPTLPRVAMANTSTSTSPNAGRHHYSCLPSPLSLSSFTASEAEAEARNLSTSSQHHHNPFQNHNLFRHASALNSPHLHPRPPRHNPFANANPNPPRHEYEHHGYSRYALMYAKWFWAVREAVWEEREAEARKVRMEIGRMGILESGGKGVRVVVGGLDQVIVEKEEVDDEDDDEDEEDEVWGDGALLGGTSYRRTSQSRHRGGAITATPSALPIRAHDDDDVSVLGSSLSRKSPSLSRRLTSQVEVESQAQTQAQQAQVDAQVAQVQAQPSTAPLPPLSVHPRRGDLSALRDPWCVHVDRMFVGMPVWTMAKTLWMYDVHVWADEFVRRREEQEEREKERKREEAGGMAERGQRVLSRRRELGHELRSGLGGVAKSPTPSRDDKTLAAHHSKGELESDAHDQADAEAEQECEGCESEGESQVSSNGSDDSDVTLVDESELLGLSVPVPGPVGGHGHAGGLAAAHGHVTASMTESGGGGGFGRKPKPDPASRHLCAPSPPSSSYSSTLSSPSLGESLAHFPPPPLSIIHKDGLISPPISPPTSPSLLSDAADESCSCSCSPGSSVESSPVPDVYATSANGNTGVGVDVDQIEDSPILGRGHDHGQGQAQGSGSRGYTPVSSASWPTDWYKKWELLIELLGMEHLKPQHQQRGREEKARFVFGSTAGGSEAVEDKRQTVCVDVDEERASVKARSLEEYLWGDQKRCEEDAGGRGYEEKWMDVVLDGGHDDQRQAQAGVALHSGLAGAGQPVAVL